MTGPAMQQLRENLREAAQRDVDARRARSRSRRRRTAGILSVAVFGAAAAAGGAELISQGEPVKDPRSPGLVYRPGVAARQLVVTAPDPGAGTRWGVSVYTARNGEHCAIAGQVNGVALGEVTNGTFHRYRPDAAGTCNDPARGTWDFLPRPDRTIVFGRMGDATKRIVVVVDGKRYPRTRGPGGAWLLVFKGKVPPSAVKVGL